MAKQKILKLVTECDFEANAAYVELSKKPVAKSSKYVDETTNTEYVLDFDKNGEVVGIEILNLAKSAILGLMGLHLLKDKIQSRASTS